MIHATGLDKDFSVENVFSEKRVPVKLVPAQHPGKLPEEWQWQWPLTWTRLHALNLSLIE